jgi:methylthioribose-1-phosphate isomerase
MSRLKTIEWIDDCARIIDQTLLPTELVYKDIKTIEGMYEAIKLLRIRGAPAIGIAAAFGLYLGIRTLPDDDGVDRFLPALKKKADYLASSRPTAVNLFWALARIQTCAQAAALAADARGIKRIILDEAKKILDEDHRMCRAIGEYGFELIKSCTAVLTHCNAGGLATSEYGTALAGVYVAQEKGKLIHVYSDETRPLLQGSRITAFELTAAGVPVTVICDNMAATVMARGMVDAAIVGADRIAANGDTANKIGTYGVALLAKAHNIPFYIAAPSSTFDLSIADGSMIPIEERPREEITCGFGKQTAPDTVPVFNPAFDVTPCGLISAIITEKGILRPPFAESIARTISKQEFR